MREKHEDADDGTDAAVSNSEDQTVLARRRLLAAQAIQKHFSMHPMSVIIVSMNAEGKVQADITEHASLGALLFNKRLLDKYIDEAFEKSLVQGKGPTPPQETL